MPDDWQEEREAWLKDLAPCLHREGRIIIYGGRPDSRTGKHPFMASVRPDDLAVLLRRPATDRRPLVPREEIKLQTALEVVVRHLVETMTAQALRGSQRSVRYLSEVLERLDEVYREPMAAIRRELGIEPEDPTPSDR